MYAAISIDAEVPVAFSPPGDIDGIIRASERNGVPLTWLIYSGTSMPEEVAGYYHDNVIHRIPRDHELGLHVHFDDHKLEHYVADPAARRELIVRGVKVLEKYGIKPTSFRAGCWCLQSCDVQFLEEASILVDSSPIPEFCSTNHPGHGDWRELTFRGPYRPSYSSLLEKGNANLVVVPVCSSQKKNAQGWCDCGYLDYRGWDELEPILKWYSENRTFISIATHDGRRNNSASHSPGVVMDRVAPFLRDRGFEFVTLTQMRNLWLEGNDDE